MKIDTSYDFRLDSNGRDPDSYSPTLRKYHQYLWSKKLPNGEFLELEEVKSTLIYRFNMQTIKFSSDSISNSYIGTKKIAHLHDEVHKSEFEDFRAKGSTIGGYIIFPSIREAGRMTINGARGFNSKIADRFDLTLECIRLNYLRHQNPLQDTLNSPINKFFFSLFVNFQQYVDFFFLQDLVDSSYSKIRYFTQIDKPFINNPIPDTASEYRHYKINTLDFLTKRNKKILEWNLDKDN